MLRKEDKPKFFVDAMLGNIARKLRLMGYDSKYSSDIDDDQLIISAKNENRTIISKDECLVKKAERLGMRPIFVTKDNEVEQFLEITKRMNLDISQINGDTARCTKCNSITYSVEKISIKDRIPHKVYDANERFWKCSACGQIYWEGTHIRNLKNFVGDINERLQ